MDHLSPIYPDNPDKNSTSSKYPDLPVRILTSGHHVNKDRSIVLEKSSKKFEHRAVNTQLMGKLFKIFEPRKRKKKFAQACLWAKISNI